MPRPRRSLLTFVTAAAICVAAVPAASAARQLSATERSVLAAINRQRLAHVLPPVVVVPALERAARIHSVDMVERSYFSHAGFPDRLWQCGAHGPVVGEDLGWSIDDGSAVSRIISMWLASSTHREILLRRGFRRVGIGVRDGPFQGWRHTVVVTADFEGN